MKHLFIKLLVSIMVLSMMLSPVALMEDNIQDVLIDAAGEAQLAEPEVDSPTDVETEPVDDVVEGSADETTEPTNAEGVDSDETTEPTNAEGVDSDDGAETTNVSSEGADVPDVEIAPDTVDAIVQEASLDLGDDDLDSGLSENGDTDNASSEDELPSSAIFEAMPLFSADQSIEINEANFPDEKFRAYISAEIDKPTVDAEGTVTAEKDGLLSVDEIEAVEEIKLAYLDDKGDADESNDEFVSWGITNLEGIQKFTRLERLECSHAVLGTLNLHDCATLSNLDLSDMKLNSLAVTIDNCPRLDTLDLNHSEITSFTVSTDTYSLFMDCHGCNIATMTVNGDNDLNVLDVYNLEQDKDEGEDNGLSIEEEEDRPVVKKLDVSQCASLTDLICGDVSMDVLDISGCNSLEFIDCAGNNLDVLDVTGKSALEELHAGGNNYTELNLSDCINLRVLKCQFSAITSLDVSNCPSLVFILNLPDPNANDGPEGPGDPEGPRVKGFRYSDRNYMYLNESVTLTPEPEVLPDSVAITEANFPDANFRQYIENNIDGMYGSQNGVLDGDEIKYTTQMNLFTMDSEGNWVTDPETGATMGLGITTLEGIEVFTNLEELNCLGNTLTGLDVSPFASLRELNCSVCGLSSLDVSNNPKLEGLFCSGNNLEGLNVSNNPKLTFLAADGNPIVSLDVTACPTISNIVDDEYRHLSYWGDEQDENALPFVEFYHYTNKGEVMLTHSLKTEIKGKKTYTPREINIANTFSDEGMRDYVSNVFDGRYSEPDGILTEDEILQIEPNCWIDLEKDKESAKKIKSLAGLEVFTGIQDLGLWDLEQLGGTLNLSTMPWLTSVWAINCNLTAINLSNSHELQELFCERNLLTTLDIQNCHENLINCVTAENYELTDNGAVAEYRYIRQDEDSGEEYHETHLQCDSDVQITGGNPVSAVAGIPINEAHFEDKNFRDYLTANYDGIFGDGANGVLSPREIYMVSDIDLHKFTGDEERPYEIDPVTNWPVGLGVTSLDGIEYFPALRRLCCSNNPIGTLDVSMLSELECLDCWECGLSELDVTHNPELLELECSVNNLSSLNISKNAKLRTLHCVNNNMTTLDISGCPVLVEKTDLATTTPEKYDGHFGEATVPIVSYHFTVADTWYDEGGNKHTEDVDCWLEYDAKVTIKGQRDSRPKPESQPAPAPAPASAPAPAPAPASAPVPETPTIAAVSKASKTTISAAPGTVAQLDLGGATGKKFKSSNKKVATVSSSGVVTIKKAGKVKITFKVGKKKRTVTLTVKDPTIPSYVTITATGPLTGKKGDTVQLRAVLPDGTNSPIKWTSSNKKVASVNSNGLVTFKTAGSAKITATAKRGKKKAKVTVQGIK